eukprot:1156257-Pelagomonas_calceolata.AAC.7
MRFGDHCLQSEEASALVKPQVKQNQFDLDFSRVAAKPLFCKLLTRIDEASNGLAATGPLQEAYYLISWLIDEASNGLVMSGWKCHDFSRMGLAHTMRQSPGNLCLDQYISMKRLAFDGDIWDLSVHDVQGLRLLPPMCINAHRVSLLGSNNCPSLKNCVLQLHEQMSAYRDQLRSIFIFYSCVASRFGEYMGSSMSHKWCTRARYGRYAT